MNTTGCFADVTFSLSLSLSPLTHAYPPTHVAGNRQDNAEHDRHDKLLL
jgi:hypothetical protein